MNILVTGGAGYLGSVLVPKLLARGHGVRVCDLGYFGLGHLRGLRLPIDLVCQDLRAVARDSRRLAELFDDMDCIIHLAAISNDPSAELNLELTEEVNYKVTVVLAEAAQRRGTKFVFSSSCSVYGQADGEIDEDGNLAPLTAYAVSKVRAEQALTALVSFHWRPVILRNGTLFGYSPRMRFDLVVNVFGLYSVLHNAVKIFGDGRQWRPFLHLGDCARAFVWAAEAPEMRHVIYNVARENLRVTDIAECFRRINPQLRRVLVPLDDIDRRDYRVSTARVAEEGFEARVSVEMGAEEITEAIIGGVITEPESHFYCNAKWLKELSDSGLLEQHELLKLLKQAA